jgi:hypothetical protein
MRVKLATSAEMMNATHHHMGVRPSTIPHTFWVIQVKFRSFSIMGRRGMSAGRTSSRTLGRYRSPVAGEG